MKTILLALSLMAYGASDNLEAPAQLQDVPSQPPPAVTPQQPSEPLSPISQPTMDYDVGGTAYVYDPVGKRDPFRPFRDAKIGVGFLNTFNRSRELEPLEKFDVKSLSVVAIVWGINKPKALVRDPSKKIHTVYKGMRMGRNEGIVAEIREGELVVVETFDYNGKPVKESFVLPIQK